MSSTQHVLAAGRPLAVKGPWRPPGRRHLHGSDFTWAIAFVVPYAAMFLGFVVYPVGYALWMASKPSLYADLIADQSYLTAVVNTVLFVGLAVNLKMFLALLLSGFFLRRRWWIKALLAVYVLPWALAATQTCISFHWMLIGEQGLVDRLPRLRPCHVPAARQPLSSLHAALDLMDHWRLHDGVSGLDWRAIGHHGC